MQAYETTTSNIADDVFIFGFCFQFDIVVQVTVEVNIRSTHIQLYDSHIMEEIS